MRCFNRLFFKNFLTINVRLIQFKKTLMDSFGPASEMAPVYESSRSCNEKWNDLINCGFAVRRNKNSIEFNIPQIKDFLELES